jgi:dTDP-4-amino-4,6-dideoxygalactose transaminase
MMIAPPEIGSKYFALKDTTLSPRMLLGRGPAGQLPWVLRHPDIRHHYLGRNASYALVKGLGLAGAEMLFPAFFGPPVLQAPIEAGANVRFYPVRAGMRVAIEDLRAALTPQTRAIYLIHFNGFPGPIAEVMELARERDLIVIEDAAHAMLTTIDGKPAGSFGDGAVFSFYKWVPVPNGAALITNRPSAHPLVDGSKRSLTSGVALSTFSLLDHAAMNWGPVGEHARSAVRAVGKRMSHATNLTYVATGGVRFDHGELDYAMSGLSHRILRAQDWQRIAARRRRNYTLLADLLSDIAPPTQGELPDGIVPLFYATNLENKRGVLLRLSARGVEGRNFWELHHPLLPEGVFPETDELRRTQLELPIHQDLSSDDIHRIAAAVRAILPSGTFRSTAQAAD